jgi:transcription termination factor Rho
VLELVKDGAGFLRQSENSYQKDSRDPYVHPGVVQRYGLLSGSEVKGMAVRHRGRSNLATVETVEGVTPEEAQQRTPFSRLTSIDPVERLRIDASNELSLRVLDLVTPIGKGQRGLIVASPRTGKTMLLQQLAQSLEQNHPEVQLMIALVDERPEEVTEMRRSTGAEVIHSSNDHPPQRHIKVVEMVLDRARRLVEGGRDVVILLDSLTRVARAYNSRSRGSGRTLSGGLDSTTMLKPREFFGAARKAEDGGSLTIIATALIDTGSRMDDVIFEEFKGTGNMELVLDRNLAERRIWPAINIHLSGTRKEEKLRSAEDQKKVNLLRRVLSDHSPFEAMRLLLSKLEKTESNEQFLRLIKAV